MKRRSFLKVVGSVTAGLSAGFSLPVPISAVVNGMPRRKLGKTDLEVSIIGFPGLALKQETQEACNAAILNALDRGVNYIDVAPAYADGECENKLGAALTGIDRSRFYLACKTKMRDKDGCREELERSLKRLRVDHFDVFQLHHLVQPADVKKALGPGGAMETILKAREQGKVRYIGFSAHTTKAAITALDGFPFDSVMFPINYVEYYTRGFGREVLDKAREKGAGVLAIKPMHGGAPKPGEELKHKWWYRTLEVQDQINLAWRFSLSMPGVVTGFPPGWLDLADKAITAGHSYRPVSADDTKLLQSMADGQGSIFKREEDSVALGFHYESPYSKHPHLPEGWA